MTPEARFQAAIELLEALLHSVEAGGLPLDRLVSDYFRQRRYAGSKDRRAVGDLVYGIVRNFEYYHWALGDNVTARGLLLAHRAFSGDSLPTFSADDRFSPSPWSPEEEADFARLTVLDWQAAPAAVKANVPAWALAGLERRFGQSFPDEAAALNTAAQLCLRLNPLKASAKSTENNFKKTTQQFEKTKYSDIGYSFTSSFNLGGFKPYKAGEVEIQDEAAQIAGYLVDAKAGMQVADMCAGAGGKSLLLAATMANKGKIHCFDIHRGRLSELEKRKKRAGVSIIQTTALPEGGDERSSVLAGHTATCDRVVLDVPCSGTGTWRRSPDLRIRFNADRVSEILKVQRSLLLEGAALVKPGGRLLYMTCSLLPAENEDQIAWFLDGAGADFKPVDYRAVCDGVGRIRQVPASAAMDQSFLCLTPHRHGTDGFFVAILERITEL